MMRALAFVFALLALAEPALAQTRALPSGEIRANGDVMLGGLKIGKLSPSATLDLSDLPVSPSATAPGGTLARRLAAPTFDGPATLNNSLSMSGPGALPVGAPGAGEMSINAPIANHYLSGNAFFTRSRFFVHNPATGEPLADWLGGGTCNAAGGGPTHYAYGACATVTAQNGIGDVAITGVTRTSDIKRAEDVNVRFSAAGNFQTFNDNFTFARTTWPLYIEGRRVPGAGQSHPEFAAVELQRTGATSDVKTPTTKMTGPNAVYSFTTAALTLESGGNCTATNGLGGCWNGTEMATATDASVALNIYNNGAKFRKGIQFGETALTGCDGTGGSNTCSAVDMAAGMGLTWTDKEDSAHSERSSARIYADVSRTAPSRQAWFTDSGFRIDGYGAPTLLVNGQSTDITGLRVSGGDSATAPATLEAVGAPNASILIKASGAGTVRTDAGYNIVNSRSLFNSDATGGPANWLGNSAGGDASSYAYGGLGQGVFLSGIGDVGVVGAVRTEDIKTSGRLPVGNMGWCFNFKTTSPQTCWGGYMEARRKVGAGQIHTLELNATELGDGSDRIVPSAMKSGPNAIYSAYASVLNLASGGNVRPGQQTGWDGTKNVTQAADIGSYLSLYSNAARAEKGIIISEDAVVGCDGTGGSNTCAGVEMGRGTDLRWIDGTTRHGSLINSDVSPSGNGQRLRFTDFGTIIDGYGGATLNVIAKSTDVNGVQVVGGGSAAAPARIVASGSPNASLGLSASGGGIVQMQSVMQLAAYTVATLPACDAARIGGMAYVTDSAAVNYRNAVNNGGGNLKAPVFCAGSAWEYH